jgi:hypothetical protein
MSPVFMAWQFMSLIVMLVAALGFAVIVVSLWRMSQSLQSIDASLRVLMADRLRMTNDQ